MGMIGRYQFARSFWHNVVFYKATNEPRFMLTHEHEAITRVIITRSIFKLVTGIMAVALLGVLRYV
ncbi:hypothetical protein NKJ88_05905 [Mesorhizobium sp. M0016]|uniref:hypothetical protein n=1 Tax=Mesorhizobium sp. M0016 TaxID=2956843 RepID=UPI00333B1676